MGCIMVKKKGEETEELQTISWGHVHTSSLENWIKHDCERFGFSLLLDYASKKGIHPWCTQGRHFDSLLPAPLDEDELDVKYVYDEMLVRDAATWRSSRVKLGTCYRDLIPHKLKVSEDLETVNVIGSRGEYIVTQVVRYDNTFDFILTHIPTCRVVGTFQEKYNKQPFLWECYISPDASVLLLKPNLNFARKHNLNTEEDALKIIQHDTTNKTYKLIHKMFEKQAQNLIIAFDPRFGYGQVAVANCQEKEKLTLGIYNLNTYAPIKGCSVTQSYMIQNIVFSPGGNLLACLHVAYLKASSSHTHYNFPSVAVYNSNDISLIHAIPSCGDHTIHNLTPAAVFPVFSKNGSYIAIPTGNGGGITHSGGVTHVEVYQVPPMLDLKDICRRCITNALTSNQIQSVPISEDLKEYLFFKPTKDKIQNTSENNIENHCLDKSCS